MCPFPRGKDMRNKNVGHPLAALVNQRIEIQGMTVSGLAIQIGFSQSYLSELLSGDKPFNKVDEDRLRSIAVFLELPAVKVFLLAGRLLHDDFFERPHAIRGQLREVMMQIAKSSFGLEASVSESMLENLPEEVKMLLALIFQDAIGLPPFPVR